MSVGLGFGGGGGASVLPLFGTAIGPDSPVGPPAAAGTWSCCFWSCCDCACDELWSLPLDWAAPITGESRLTAARATSAAPKSLGSLGEISGDLRCFSEYIDVPHWPVCLLV